MTASSTLSSFVPQLPLQVAPDFGSRSMNATARQTNQSRSRLASSCGAVWREATGLLPILYHLMHLRLLLNRGYRTFRVTLGTGKVVEGKYQACHVHLGNHATPLEAKLGLHDEDDEYVVDLALADIKSITAINAL